MDHHDSEWCAGCAGFGWIDERDAERLGVEMEPDARTMLCPVCSSEALRATRLKDENRRAWTKGFWVGLLTGSAGWLLGALVALLRT